jgi:PAS domain-containing protein
MHARTVPDNSGAALCTIFYCIGITDKKRLEKNLGMVQEQFRHAIEFLPDPTLIIDNEGIVIAWNNAMEQLSGKSAGEMLGMGDYAYALPFHGEGRPVLIDLIGKPIDEVYAKYPKAQISGPSIYAEVFAPGLPSGGRHLWAKASPIFDSAGNRIGAIESIRDITEWKQIEDAREIALQRREAEVHEKLTGCNMEYARLVEELSSLKTSHQTAITVHGAILAATDLIFILDAGGRILFANHSAESFLENDLGGIVGRTILSFITDEYRIRILKILSGSSDNPGVFDFSFYTPSGSQPVVASISFSFESVGSSPLILLMCKKKM